MSALATIAGRTCEDCGAVQARHDDLHLCGCRDQQNLCKPCREACAAKLRGDDMPKEIPTNKDPLYSFADIVGHAKRLKLQTVSLTADHAIDLEKAIATLREKAAGVPALLERIADYEESYRKVMTEQCAPDERHCTCVPHLKRRIAELEAEKAQASAGGEDVRA